jgi:hypothetical protein
MSSRERQISLLRAPKYWPAQTVEMLLPLITMATEDPVSAEVSAILRVSLREYSSATSDKSWASRPSLKPEDQKTLTEYIPREEGEAEQGRKKVKLG